MGGSIRPHLRSDEHALASTRHTPGIGGQLPSFAARIRSARRVLDARNMSKRQLAALMIALQLRLDLSGRIVQHQVIATPTRFTRLQLAAAQTAQGLLFRQLPWRHMRVVVQHTKDQRMVDVPVDEDHAHFLTDPRQANMPELDAGTRRHHAQPGRAVLVVVVQPVPMKLDLDPPIAIGMDLGAGRPDHDGGLDAVIGAGLAVVVPARAPLDILAHAVERVFVVRWRPRSGLVVVAGFVVDGEDQVVAITDAGLGRFATLGNAQLGAEVVGELEAPARLGGTIVAAGFEGLRVGVALAHALLRELFALVMGAETVRARVFIDFVGEDVALVVQGLGSRALRDRVLVVEAGQGRPAGAEAAHRAPFADTVVFERTGLVAERDFAGIVDPGRIDGLRQRAPVAEPERVPVGPVLVPVVQPELFPAAVQVVVVGLVVLVRAGHARILADDDRIPVGLAVVGKGEFGEFDDALAMERPVVLAQLGECQPRLEDHVVEREAAIGANETEFGDIAVEVA